MNIDGLSDQDKSVMLARAMGWKIGHDKPVLFRVPESNSDTFWGWFDNLYDVGLMALAWRVLNWAYREDKIFSLAIDVYEFGSHFLEWAPKTALEAQRLWLDKILEMAIEVGLVEQATKMEES